MSKKTYSHKRIFVAAMAAVLLLATLTGAAAFTRWSRTAQAQYAPSEDVKNQAENSGLSVMLEENGTNDILSATDQSITVTTLQTIVDNYGAELIFRIDGFQIPEGRFPWTWTEVTIDGNTDFYAYMGKSYYTESSDDSFECTISITFDNPDGRYIGKEIAVEFLGFGLDSMMQAGEAEKYVEGSWLLHWPLTGASHHLSVSTHTAIGSTNIVLMEAEIGQVSLRTVYQLDSYYSGWETMETFYPALCGIRMKDGTIHSCYPRSEGYLDEENLIYFVEHTMDHSIIDLSQADALVFSTDLSANEDGFCFIPIQ